MQNSTEPIDFMCHSHGTKDFHLLPQAKSFVFSGPCLGSPYDPVIGLFFRGLAEVLQQALTTRTLTGLGVLLLLVGASWKTRAQSKPILVGVKVEAEGGGKGQGMWAQAASDLTPRELKTLETLVVAEMKKQEGVKIVQADYPEDFIAVVVVAAKLPNGGTGKWYIASSVLTIATKKGIDELVTHDVVAEADLASLARTIGFQFASVKLRAAMGLWK